MDLQQQTLNFRRESQSNLILSHLQSGRTINPLESLRLYNCFRLGGRIFDLRKAGHKIERRMIEVSSGAKVAEYFLANENQNALAVGQVPSGCEAQSEKVECEL